MIKTIFLLSAAIFPAPKLHSQERWHRWKIWKCNGLQVFPGAPETTANSCESIYCTCCWPLYSICLYMWFWLKACVCVLGTHTHPHANTPGSGSELIMLCTVTETAFSELECLWQKLLTFLFSKHAKHTLPSEYRELLQIINKY